MDEQAVGMGSETHAGGSEEAKRGEHRRGGGGDGDLGRPGHQEVEGHRDEDDLAAKYRADGDPLHALAA